MLDSIVNVLRSAWQELLSGVTVLLPHLLAMLSLVIVGWLFAWLFAFVVRLVLRALRFDILADRMGATALLKKAALPHASDVAGLLAFWLVWIAFMLSGLGALGYSGTHDMINGFIAFLPRLGLGLILLVVGTVASNFAWRATLLGAVNSNLPSARLLSGAVRWLILALTVAMALEQIGVAKTIMLTAFAIAFGAVMLGVAVAIGIGGGPIARRLLERQFPDPPEPEKGSAEREMSHL